MLISHAVMCVRSCSAPAFVYLFCLCTAAMSIEQPSSSTGVSDVDGDHQPEVISKETAALYRAELATRRAKRGKGSPLTDDQIQTRLVRLRRRNAALPERYRAADAKVLAQLEKTIGEIHAVSEAVAAVGSSVAIVDSSVAAMHQELRETRREMHMLMEGKNQTPESAMGASSEQLEGTSNADRIAALTAQQVAIANTKRLLVAADKESRRKAAAAKAEARKQQMENRMEERKQAIAAKAEARKRRLEEEAERREAAKPLVEPPPRPKRKKPYEDLMAAKTTEQRSWFVTPQKVETDRNFGLFCMALEKKPVDETWAVRLARDAAAEAGMSVVDRLNREDERRWVMENYVTDNTVMVDCPNYPVDPRTKPDEAIVEIDARREKLIGQLPAEDQEAYESFSAKMKAAKGWHFPVNPQPAEPKSGARASAEPIARPAVPSESEAMTEATTPPYNTTVFKKLMDAKDQLGDYKSWKEKYAQDAADEASMSLFQRLIREKWRRQEIGGRQIALSRGGNPRRGLSSAELAERTVLVDAMRESNSRMVDLQAKMTMREIHAMDAWDKACMTQTRL